MKMSVKRILNFKDEEDKKILTSISEPVVEVNDEIKEIIQDMKDTLNNTKTGVGLSAVQIGVLKQICIVKYNGKIYTLINPTITKTRGEVIFREGCLSVPGVYTEVKRFQKVWVDYIDEEGKTREEAQGGLFSVVVQHEMDHFKGECAVENAALANAEADASNKGLD